MANKKVSQLSSKPSVLVTDLFPIADPSTGQLYKTTISDLGTAIGSGVSSVNGLVGAVVLDTDDIQELVSPTNKWFTDTRARAALSASSPLAYNSGTGVFSIPAATSSQNGYLTSTDWTTFNSKQAALSGTGFVKINGTTISYDNSTYLTTSAAASTYLALAGGTLTGALNGTSATFTGDLTISSANPRIYLTDTDNNPDYFISNTDGTFTIYDVTNSLSRFTIGTTGNATFRNAITGGGSITGESIYSNGIVSVGTALSVGTTISATSSITGSALYVTGMTAGSGAIYFSSTLNRLTFANYNTNGILHFEVNGGSPALILNANLSATFSAGIAATSATFSAGITATTAGFSGALSATTGTFSGNLTVGNAVAGTNVKIILNGVASKAAGFEFHQSGTPQWYLGNGIASEDNNFELYNSNGTMAIKIIKSTNAINFQGAATFLNTSNVPILIKSSSGSNTSYLYSANAGSSSDYQVAYGSLNNDASIVAGGSTKMTITSTGNVGIGTTAPGGKLDIVGDVRGYSFALTSDAVFRGGLYAYRNIAGSGSDYGVTIFAEGGTGNGNIYFCPGGSATKAATITSGGNLLVGTTSDNGYKLRVNGNIWFDGSLNATNGAFNQPGTTSLYLSNTTISGGSSSGVTGLYFGDAGSGINTITREKISVNTARTYIYTEHGYNVQTVGAYFYNGAAYQGNNSSSWSTTSDRRIKDNIRPLNNSLEKLLALNPCHFEYKNKLGQIKTGFIAQEFEEVLPGHVHEQPAGKEYEEYVGEGNTIKSIDTDLIPYLVKALQELKAELDTLKNK
jgi:hypothetical protein